MCQRKLNLSVRGLFKGNQFLAHPFTQDKILPHPSFSSIAPQLAQRHPLEFPFTTFAFVCVCVCVCVLASCSPYRTMPTWFCFFDVARKFQLGPPNFPQPPPLIRPGQNAEIHMAIFHLKRSHFATLDSQSQQGGPRAPTESGQLGATTPFAKLLITSAGPLFLGCHAASTIAW